MPWKQPGNGLFVGEFALFKAHMIAVVFVIAFTFVGAFVIPKSPIWFYRDEGSQKKKGWSDLTQHGENLYPSEYSKQLA